MLLQKNKRGYCIILILVAFLSIVSCLDSSLVQQIENQAATLQAIEDVVEEYLTPVQNLSVEPGEKAGEVILSWEHPLGDQLTFKLYLYDLPITEENWNIIGSFEIKQRDITTERINQTYRMSYHWDSVPVGQKYWVVVRQSIEGLSEVGLAFELLEPIIGIEIPEDTWLIPPSVIAPSNMVSIIDTGFRPDPNGYDFKNRAPRGFSPSISRQDYIDMLRWVFGDDDVCIINIFGECLPRSSARKLARKKIKSGQCSGFTTSTGLFFLGRVEESNFVDRYRFGSIDTIDINSNEKILDFIMAYQYLLVQDEIVKEWEASLYSSLDENLQSLEDLMLDSWNVPNLSIYPNREDCGGHSVLPYLFVSEEGKWTDVWVYDSNYIGDNSRVVNFNLESDTWEYYFTDEDLWVSSTPSNIEFYGSFQVHNISNYKDVDNGDYIGKAPWQNDGKIIFTESLNSILITSSDNKRIGFTQSGEYVDEIPDAYLEVIDNVGTYLFVLPSGDYEYTVYTIADQNASFMSLGNGGSLFVESISEGDHISEQGDSVAYHNDEVPTSPEISVILETSDQSTRVSVTSTLSIGSTITIHSEAGTGKFSVFSSEPLNYELEIEVITSEGEYNFENNNIVISPDETDIIQVEDNLSDDDPFIIGIDDDGDGISDEENELENHYTPEPEEDDDNNSSIKIILIVVVIILLLVLVVGVIMSIVRKRRLRARADRNKHYRRPSNHPQTRNKHSASDHRRRKGYHKNSRRTYKKRNERNRRKSRYRK